MKQKYGKISTINSFTNIRKKKLFFPSYSLPSWIFELQITSHPELKDVVKNHFTGVFQSTCNKDFSRLLSSVPHLISEEMYNSSCKVVSQDEILKAVKQLGALKAPGKDGYPGFFFRKDETLSGLMFVL